jgi:acyl carrier protein
MTRDEVFKGVQDIFRDIFDEDDLIISDSTNSDEIEDWDSLNHINLVSAIEQEFKIKFALGELMTLKDVGAMIDLMLGKLKSL